MTRIATAAASRVTSPGKANGNGHGDVGVTVVRELMNADLARSGLTEGDMLVRPSLKDLRGRSGPHDYGYFLTYPDPATGKPTDYERFRYLDTNLGFGVRRAHNYDGPKGRHAVYFSRLVDWAAAFEDTTRDLFETEGEKKAEAGCKAGYRTLGIGGVYNWKVKNEERLLPELDLFEWSQRRVYLVYDSDLRSNGEVRQALDRHAAVLTERGATVRIIYLPDLTPGGKTGLDDFLVAQGKTAFDALVEQAEEWQAAQRILRSEPLYRAVEKAERILATNTDYKLFLHGTELVRVVEQQRDSEPNAALRRSQGCNYLSEMKADNVEFLLSKSGCVFSKSPEEKKKYIPADPKTVWARQVVANLHAFPDRVPWRRLHLVTTTPLLLEDGSLIDQPGYHAGTGVWFDPRGCHFPPVPVKPTRKQARTALDKFANVYAKFPFATTADRQHWNLTPSYAAVLATILSVLIRHLLPTVPMLGITAPEAGTGKTKIAESIAAAATGFLPTRISYDGTEEFEKLLPVALRAGERTLVIDNVDHKMVNSPKLAQILTTDEPTDFRVLGESRIVKTPNRSVILATGNQLTITGDLPRRSLQCRLNAKDEQPEMRSFEFDPVTRAREQFPALVSAALTALRYYFRSDCPQPKYKGGAALQSGSFEDWNRRVRGLLVHLGFGDPLATQKEVRIDNPILQEEVMLLRALYILFPAREFMSGQVKNAALMVPQLKGGVDSEEQREARNELRAAFTDRESRWNARALGYRLRDLRDRKLDGLQLNVVGQTHGMARYRVTKYDKKQQNGGVGWDGIE